MYVIGLTGGIASGKSAVAAALREVGACVIDADRLAHEQAEPGGTLFNVYVEHFGERIITDSGELHRGAIGEIIFRNPLEKQWIDRTSHPILFDELKRRIESCRTEGCRVIILDVPLLFEAGWDSLCDEIWVVSVPLGIQTDRLMMRDSLTREQAEARISAQMSLKEKCSRGNVVLDNSGSIQKTQDMARQLYKERVASYAGEYP